MKKAIIATGGHQYLVHEGETLATSLLQGSEGYKHRAEAKIESHAITVSLEKA